MTCVLCLYVNPPAAPACLRCRRVVTPPAVVTDDTDRVSFDPAFELMVDSGSLNYQPTELCNTLDSAPDPTPASVLFPPGRPTLT